MDRLVHRAGITMMFILGLGLYAIWEVRVATRVDHPSADSGRVAPVAKPQPARRSPQVVVVILDPALRMEAAGIERELRERIDGIGPDGIQVSIQTPATP